MYDDSGLSKGHYLYPCLRIAKAHIISYDLDRFRALHRVATPTASDFGCNDLPRSQFIPGFELYSSFGLAHTVGPLKSEFYRISFAVKGTLQMQIGLQQYEHQPGTIAFTYPNQIFAKQISADTFGYYLLFTANFIHELLPAKKLPVEFPFLGPGGIPVFSLAMPELQRCIQLMHQMDEEVRGHRPERNRAVQLYLYLLLLEAKRSFAQQGLDDPAMIPKGHALVTRFQTLVSMHFITRRKVADYARLLSVSANHLNKATKEVTGRTASETIREMLIQEVKSLLHHTTASISEIAYQLEFDSPAAFHRFFKSQVGETPMTYRKGKH
jgi:AraC family transcriptional activator of pobA